MRKLILLMGMTLDGCDAGGWIPEDSFSRADVQEELWTQLASIDTFIMGRVTYEIWFDAWPKLRTSESQTDARFSRFADDVEKVVISNSLATGEWKNSRIIGGDIAAKISQLKQQSGKDMAIVGGAKIAQSIGKLGLVDDYRLWLQPVILGRGTSLLDVPRDAVELDLIQVKSFGSRLVAVHYTRRK
jgi:dihydrofolate reductase